jgi:hypothetical protein
MFCVVNAAAARWPRAIESFRNLMISALVFMLAGPLPSSPRPSGSLSPVIGDR